MTDVEDLVTRVAGTLDPDVALVRDKVLEALDAARTSMSVRVRERAIKDAGTTNNLTRVSPWQAFGIAALLGAAVGYLARRRA